jgi:hypothetical protein
LINGPPWLPRATRLRWSLHLGSAEMEAITRVIPFPVHEAIDSAHD